MKILFIGYSNVFKKRIIPILNKLEFIDAICIAKYKNQNWDNSYNVITKPLELYDNYEDAFAKSNANIAYISTTNNSHYLWAKFSLMAGIHTIIDKPATIHFSEAKELLDIAKQKNILVSESTVYLYHPQFSKINELMAVNNFIPKLLTAHFSFPPMDKSNFRYNKDLGGGAFLDTIPYAISIGRYIFNSNPEFSKYIINEKSDSDVEISYSLLLKYSSGRSLIGHFGFNSEYINRINILGSNFFIDIDRVFTIPESKRNVIKVMSNNVFSETKVDEGNAFLLYLNFIVNSIKNNSFNKLYEDFYNDSYSKNFIIKNNL
jgi:NDP-hexose-3-ketoreductase